LAQHAWTSLLSGRKSSCTLPGVLKGARFGAILTPNRKVPNTKSRGDPSERKSAPRIGAAGLDQLAVGAKVELHAAGRPQRRPFRSDSHPESLSPKYQKPRGPFLKEKRASDRSRRLLRARLQGDPQTTSPRVSKKALFSERFPPRISKVEGTPFWKKICASYWPSRLCRAR
jgi:hypothetical protein